MSQKNVFSAVILMTAMLFAGCSQYTLKPTSFTLPTSNKHIDVVLHRSDIRFTDCGTLTVIQTYDGEAKLIDAQSSRGVALHCNVIQAGIEAGGRIGAAAVFRPASTRVNNAVNNSQSQTQTQSPAIGTGDTGGSGSSSSGGNNGFGNGSDDGVPGGSGHDDTSR
jgi:hypothetical protein